VVTVTSNRLAFRPTYTPCVPSYRLELEIGDLRPGRSPDEVMEAARVSLGHQVEATDIALVAGTPRILLRFTVPASSAVEENASARLAAHHAREAVEVVAGTGRSWLLRRRRGSWLALG
jgi:hypothetical protein